MSTDTRRPVHYSARALDASPGAAQGGPPAACGTTPRGEQIVADSWRVTCDRPGCVEHARPDVRLSGELAIAFAAVASCDASGGCSLSAVAARIGELVSRGLVDCVGPDGGEVAPGGEEVVRLSALGRRLAAPIVPGAPATGNRLEIVKGCRALWCSAGQLTAEKGQIARVLDVTCLGSDYSYACRVVLRIGGSVVTLTATHPNRLGDENIRLTGDRVGQAIVLRRTLRAGWVAVAGGAPMNIDAARTPSPVVVQPREVTGFDAAAEQRARAMSARGVVAGGAEAIDRVRACGEIVAGPPQSCVMPCPPALDVEALPPRQRAALRAALAEAEARQAHERAEAADREADRLRDELDAAIALARELGAEAQRKGDAARQAREAATLIAEAKTDEAGAAS